MKSYYLASTLHLSINFANITLENNKLIRNCSERDLDKLIDNQPLWPFWGLNFKSSLLQRSLFFKTLNVESLGEFQREAGSWIIELQLILDLLWFVKDSNCYLSSVGCYLENGECGLTGLSYKRYNASGQQSNVDFTTKDFELAYGVLSGLVDIVSIDKHVQNKMVETVDTNYGNTRFSRTTPYHDLDQARRVLLFLTNARSTDILPEKISNYILILECLFIKGKGQEITQKVSERVAFYMHKGFDERIDTFNFIKRCYDIRSSYVHGDVVQPAYQLNKGEIKKTLAEISVRLDSLVRHILLNSYTIDQTNFYNNPDIDTWFNQLVFGFDFSQTPPSEAT